MIRITTVAALLVAGAALTGCFGKEEANETTTEVVEPAADVQVTPETTTGAAPADQVAPSATEPTAAPATETTY